MVHGLGGTAMGKCLYEPIIRKVENMDFRNGGIGMATSGANGKLTSVK